jgi:hypothetical protein
MRLFFHGVFLVLDSLRFEPNLGFALFGAQLYLCGGWPAMAIPTATLCEGTKGIKLKGCLFGND